MENEHLLPVNELCTHYNIEVSFVNSLTEFGLLEVITVQEVPCVEKQYIRELEKLIRMHYDLNINLEGIDAIYHLLNRVSSLQQELETVKNRLKFHEGLIASSY